MESGIFFDAIEEIVGCVVAGVGPEAVASFRENVVEDDCLRERSIVIAVERGIVGSIPLVCGGQSKDGSLRESESGTQKTLLNQVRMCSLPSALLRGDPLSSTRWPPRLVAIDRHFTGGTDSREG